MSRVVFADLKIDLERQQVCRDGQVLPVQGLSFQLLAYLLAQSTRVVGFDELIAQVWAPAVVGEETVTQRVKLLRQALGDDGRHPRYVRSVRGRGYQLCEMPTLLAAVEPVVVAAMPQQPAGAGRRSPLRGIAVLAILMLAGAATYVWWPRAAAPGTVSEDPTLARARYYAGIGQRDDNERAIVLFQQMLDARPEAAVDDPQRRAAVLGLSRAHSARRCLYNFDPGAALHGLALAEQLVATDPADSSAHAARGYALDCLGRIDRAISAYTRAFELAPAQRQDSRASLGNLLQVRGRLAEALAVDLEVERGGAQLRFLTLQIARVLDLLGFVAAAEQRYRSQFQLFPDNPYISAAYPRFLFSQGRATEAERALQEALDRPQHPDLQILAGELALQRGDRAAARQAFAAAVALKSGISWPRTLVLLHAEPPTSAQQLAARAQLLRSEQGDTDVWSEALLEIALLENASGQPGPALVSLERAVDLGYSDRAYLQTSVLFRPLATQPGFAALLDRIAQRVAEERRRALQLPGVQSVIGVAGP